MSGFEAERAAIEAKFATGWANRTPVAFDNSRFISPTAGSWVRLTIIPGDSFNASLGVNHVRNVGIISLQIFVQEDSGTRQARQLADQAATILENQRFNGIRTRAASLARVGESGSYLQMNLNVPYYRDVII